MSTDHYFTVRNAGMLFVSIALHEMLLAGLQAPRPVSVPVDNALAVAIVLNSASAPPTTAKPIPAEKKPRSLKPAAKPKKVAKPIPVKKKKVKVKRLKKWVVKKVQVAKVAPRIQAEPVEEYMPPPAIAVKPASIHAVAARLVKQEPVTTPPLILNPDYREPPTPPEYPRRARRFRQQGTVLVRALVSPEGKVEKIKIFSSSSHPLLDKSALSAVRRWEFIPARSNGQPVESWVQVPVNFVLN